MAALVMNEMNEMTPACVASFRESNKVSESKDRVRQLHQNALTG
jgi:hypothetical protein